MLGWLQEEVLLLVDRQCRHQEPQLHLLRPRLLHLRRLRLHFHQDKSSIELPSPGLAWQLGQGFGDEFHHLKKHNYPIRLIILAEDVNFFFAILFEISFEKEKIENVKFFWNFGKSICA